jgi:hypothetical protein
MPTGPEDCGAKRRGGVSINYVEGMDAIGQFLRERGALPPSCPRCGSFDIRRHQCRKCGLDN